MAAPESGFGWLCRFRAGDYVYSSFNRATALWAFCRQCPYVRDLILNRITIALLLGFLIFRLYQGRLSGTVSAMPS